MVMMMLYPPTMALAIRRMEKYLLNIGVFHKCIRCGTAVGYSVGEMCGYCVEDRKSKLYDILHPVSKGISIDDIL